MASLIFLSLDFLLKQCVKLSSLSQLTFRDAKNWESKKVKIVFALNHFSKVQPGPGTSRSDTDVKTLNEGNLDK